MRAVQESTRQAAETAQKSSHIEKVFTKAPVPTVVFPVEPLIFPIHRKPIEGEKDVIVAQIPSGKLLYDTDRRVVSSPFLKEAVKLGSIDGGILQLLMSHPLRVFSIAQIAEVWTKDTGEISPSDYLIRNAVSHLRKRLGDQTDDTCIRRFKGPRAGYSLTAQLSHQEIEEAIRNTEDGLLSEDYPEVTVYNGDKKLFLIPERNLAGFIGNTIQTVTQLSDQETACLQFLMRCEDTIASPDSLLRVMSKSGQLYNKNRDALKTVVNQIKRKLGNREFIVNVRRFGYRLASPKKEAQVVPFQNEEVIFQAAA